MINFIDENGKQHSAIVECKKTKGVNGEKSLTGTIYTNDEILEGIGRGWRLQFEDENYCLTYANPIDEGTRIVVEFDAVHEFFFDMSKSVVYAELNGSNTATAYLDFIFNGSGYEYHLEVTIPAFEKESFGMKNRLDLFKDFVSSTGVEFSVNGKIVRILEKVGSNLSTIVKKGFNLNELRIEKNIGNFITYLRGYGAYNDPEDQTKGRLEVEYLSPLASIYGKLEGDPIVDERYKNATSLTTRLKNEIESSYGISVDIDMEDLTKAGYEYDQPHEGDYIMAINKDLGFEQKIRIMSYTTSYDTEGNVIDHDVSCGSDNLVSQVTKSDNDFRKNVQAGLENAVNTANQAWISADGKNKVFTGTDEPVATNKGDIWYQVDGEKTIMKFWNGFEWQEFIDPKAVQQAAQNAEAVGNAAQSAADEAKEVADEAKTAGQNAKDIANQASTNAQTALNNANNAVDKATQASQKADSSATMASDAKNQAATAVSNASTALANANKAIKDVGDLSSVVTTNTSSIEDLEDKVAIKADKSTVDAVTGRVSTAEGNITTMAGQISLKANQSDVDTVKGRVSATEASLTLQDGKITALTTKTDGLDTSLTSLAQDYNGFKGTVYTKSQTDTKITTVQASVDQFKTTVSNTYSTKTETQAVKNSVDSLGTNIAYAWSPDGTDRFTRDKPNENYNRAPRTQISSPPSSIAGDAVYDFRIGKIPAEFWEAINNSKDRKYSISFDARLVSKGTLGFSSYVYFSSSPWNANGQLTIPAGSTELVHFEENGRIMPMNQTVTDNFFLRYRSTTDLIQMEITNFKIEVGSLTIYTTNPQDDYDNAVPRYMGRSIKDSNSPTDYKWDPNPERKPWTVYAQDVNGKDLSLMPYGENKLIGSDNGYLNNHKFYQGDSKLAYSNVNGWRKVMLNGVNLSNEFVFNTYIDITNDGRYTQSIIFDTDANVSDFSFTFFSSATAHQYVTAKIEKLSNGYYRAYASKDLPSGFKLRVSDFYVTSTGGTYISFRYPKLELANTMGIPTPWTPAPSEDPLGAIPKYVGTAALPYEDWTKYDWRLSSDWNEVKTSTSIDQTNKAIILKADQTTVNEVTGRVTTAEGKITILSDRMNFRITNSDGSITQIDLANKVISLSGEQVNITGNTYIANGVIKTANIADLAVSTAKIANLAVTDAKISSLTANKLTAGTIDANVITVKNISASNITGGTMTADRINGGTINGGNVNIINLNASNITSGTISGTNLSINLSTGVVNFKKGRINSASNNIDINIDAGYFSVADSSTRVIIKGGELQFVSPTIFDLDTNPYLSIDNSGGSQGLYGASIVGRDFISLANRANNTNMFDIPIGLEAFAGISFGKPSGSWRPTKIGGAERGIILSGGAALSDSLDSFKGSPRIVIGSDVGGQAGGNRIYILGEYIHMRSVYTKTTSTAANVVVATDGALVRSTSASKYKSDIQRFYDTSIGEKLLDLPYATWLDKAEMQRYSENPTLPIPRKNFGMIAEDLADAGLEELVVRGENNQLEGIQYERLAVALIPVIRELKQEIETLKARVA